MAYTEVTRVEIVEVIRQWQAGRKIREMVRSTGIARNTVRKYLLAAQSCGVTRDGPPPDEAQIIALVQLGRAGPRDPAVPTDNVLEPWADQIHSWLKDGKGKVKLTRIQELLAQKGCLVSYSSLERYATRKGWFGRRSRATVRMADTDPGQMAEVDFGQLGLVRDPETGRRRLTWGLVTVLGYSRHTFVWPLYSQQLPAVIEGLEAAWAFFGGLPRYLVLDNFPAAVVGPDPLNPRLTRGFLEYAGYRGFIADPARPGHAKDKPKVERGVPYVRERFFKGGQFTGLADMRDQARRWCLETAGQRVHGTTRRLPLVVFQDEEQSQLLPYDGEPYDVPEWRDAVVHRDHHVYYRYAIYSAPDATCPPGTKVEVRGDLKLVKLYRHGKLLKVHPRQPRGGRSTDPEDYPRELTPYTLRSPDYLRKLSAQLGESVGEFADKLLGGPLPWYKIRQAFKLLRLGEKYTALRLNSACQKALSVDLIDVRRLERILIQALEEESEAAATPSASAALPGRFARPGGAFALHEAHQAPSGRTEETALNETARGGTL